MIVVLVAGSCDTADPALEARLVCTHGPAGQVLQPVEVGNFWEYEFFWRGVLSDAIRISVVEELPRGRFSDERAFDLIETRGGEPATPATRKDVWANGPGGLTLVGRIFDIDADTVSGLPLLTHPFPAVSGEEYYWHLWTPPDGDPGGERFLRDSTRYEVVSPHEPLETLFGTFTTHVYTHFAPTPGTSGHNAFLHYAPGFGLAAWTEWPTRFARVGTPSAELRLIDYCIKQAEDNP